MTAPDASRPRDDDAPADDPAAPLEAYIRAADEFCRSVGREAGGVDACRIGSGTTLTVGDVRRASEEIRRLRAERDDERSLLIGVARAYIACHRRFGQPDQPTYMQFPRIQGSRPWNAVEALAAIEGELTINDPAAIAERVKAAGLPGKREDE